jgi:hypothetical protein
MKAVDITPMTLADETFEAVVRNHILEYLLHPEGNPDPHRALEVGIRYGSASQCLRF